MEAFTSSLEIITKGEWQWQSNPDPWSKSEEPQWEAYSLENNYRIEKAYYDMHKEVDIGEYVVSIRHMIQKKKGSAINQRRIRRVNWGESSTEESDRSERYFETEFPKTMNKVFGSLGDFISFFSRRNPEILEFAKQFKEVEQLNDLDALNNRIRTTLVQCLEQELIKPILERLKDDSLSKLQKKILLRKNEVNEELVLSFKKDFCSFEEFYGQILKAYTMSACLYANLNRYLRNESWVEVDKLLPYAFCLCKAFFNFKLAQFRDCFKELGRSILLYRGTAFDEHSLSFYNTETIKLFSWNSVTSTSRNKQVAEEFMYKSVDIKNKRYPVMFIIEVPLVSDFEREHLNWIDVHQYSAMPSEDEVILPPGSVFEVLECSKDQDERTTIRLKLKSEIQSLAHEGVIMQGTLQSEMMRNKEVKIVCLEGEELYDSLICLTGNKLIEGIEFCLCTFDNRSLGVMIQILPTLERARELKFISCIYRDKEKFPSSIFSPEEGCNISRIEISEMNDFYKLLTINNGDDKYWRFLSEFNVNFRNNGNAADDKMDNEWLQGLRRLTQLKSLTLDFKKCRQMADEGVSSLASQALRNLTSLESLKIHFYRLEQLTDEGMESLACEGLQYLTQLSSLTLDFPQCNKITDNGLTSLACQGIKYLTHLTSLTLDFRECQGIADEGLRSLAAQGLKYHTQLTSLALDFRECKGITDEGMRSLAAQGLKYLTQLTSLSLSVSRCNQITDEGMRDLVAQGMKYLTQLTSLTLDFRECQGIADEGLRSLAAQGLKYHTQLTSLALDFRECKGITDEGMRSLAAQGLKYLTQLTSLSLSVSQCSQITDEGIRSLAAQGLKYLTQLTTLALGFSQCDNITNEGMNSITSQGLKYLTQLTSLTLNFRECKRITDEGLRSLAAQGLKYLTQLTTLALDFSCSNQLTDEGASILACTGLQYLTQLTSLSLDFSFCNNITNKEVRNLAILKGLTHFSQFTSKALGITSDSNDQISLLTSQTPTEEMSLSFTRVKPKHFFDPILALENSSSSTQPSPYLSESSQHERFEIATSLMPSNSTSTWKGINASEYGPQTTALKLDLIGFNKIRDEGGTRFFSQLRSLTLDFSFLDEMTNEGIQSLAYQGLKNLPQLLYLNLNFDCCEKVTDNDLTSLASQALKCLTQLTSLTLNFRGCKGITDEGLKSLAAEGLKYLTQLTTLALDFSCSNQLTDEGASILACTGLQYLTQLTSLSLSFSQCIQITDEGVNSLAYQGLRHLIQLTALKIDLSCCDRLTDEGVLSLISQGLKHLTQLVSFSLNINQCTQITKFTLSNLLRILRYFGFSMAKKGKNMVEADEIVRMMRLNSAVRI